MLGRTWKYWILNLPHFQKTEPRTTRTSICPLKLILEPFKPPKKTELNLELYNIGKYEIGHFLSYIYEKQTSYSSLKIEPSESEKNEPNLEPGLTQHYSEISIYLQVSKTPDL